MIRRVISSIKRNGVVATAKKSYKFIKWKVKSKFAKKSPTKIIEYQNYNNIIIFENNFGWERLIKQRPQQVAENFSENVLFIYHSHDDNDYKGCKDRIKKIKNNLFLVDLGYYRQNIFDELVGVTIKKFLMVYSTDFIPEERIELYKKHGFYLLYDYVDDIDKKLCGDAYDSLIKRHENIIRNDSNIIITTATKLYNNVVEKNPKANVTLVTNGVNYDHFNNTGNDYIPDDIKSIKKKYKRIIGYYGALANWYDYKLIKELSKAKPNYAIVLIGINYDNSLDKSGIEKLDNVIYLGKKKYEELPYYVHNFDVCMIPFLINEITLSTSPVKLFEYMAANKPIVTTALPECMKYKSVFISKDHKEFIENIDKAIEKIKDSKYLKKLDEEARNNLWCNKCKDIESKLDEQVSRIELFRKKLRERLSSGEIDRVIIWRSPFGWNVPLFQRPQHISKAFSNNRCLVIYEVTDATDVVDEFDTINNNLFLAPMERQLTLDTVLHTLDEYPEIPKYIQIYSTNWSMSGETMQLYIDSGFKILYEYIDDLSPELAGTDQLPKYVVDKYNKALQDDINIAIVVTANEIEKDVLKKRGKKNYCFACNGVDVDHFRKIDKKFKFEKKYLDILNNGKINIGYYGALAKWFDYELIRKINDTNKYNIILFGIKYDDAFDKSKIEKLENVYFLGARQYDILPNYASKIDVLTIPFVINSITQATSPLKLFEYMALEKPIVTTAMNECKKYESVLIGKNHEDFIKKLEEAYKKRNDDNYKKLLLKEANENSWSEKAKTIIKLLAKMESRKDD
jgi:hypothetical protein